MAKSAALFILSLCVLGSHSAFAETVLYTIPVSESAPRPLEYNGWCKDDHACKIIETILMPALELTVKIDDGGYLVVTSVVEGKTNVTEVYKSPSPVVHLSCSKVNYSCESAAGDYYVEFGVMEDYEYDRYGMKTVVNGKTEVRFIQPVVSSVITK